MKKLAFYNINDVLFQTIKNLKELSDIHIFRFDDSKLSLYVKDIFEMDDTHGVSKEFDKSYLIMSGFSVDDFKQLNKTFEENNINFDGIKITRTAKNENWSIKNLLVEVNDEDLMIKSKTILKDILISMNNINLNKYSDDLTFGLKKTLMHGFLILNAKDVELSQIEEAINNINYFKENLN